MLASHALNARGQPFSHLPRDATSSKYVGSRKIATKATVNDAPDLSRLRKVINYLLMLFNRSRTPFLLSTFLCYIPIEYRFFQALQEAVSALDVLSTAQKLKQAAPLGARYLLTSGLLSVVREKEIQTKEELNRLVDSGKTHMPT